MFTGLIERVGRLERIVPRQDGARLEVTFDPWDDLLEPGESVAVQGACLTATEVHPDRCAFDVLRETLERTSLGDRRSGAALNLERALAVGDRLGGHFVTGHVDGQGTLRAATRRGADLVLDIAAPADLMPGLVPKGSIAVDGISLTVARLLGDGFTVHIIPWTEGHTSLRERVVGDRVNLETDLLGKFVQRSLACGAAGDAGIRHQDLVRAGFLTSSGGSAGHGSD